MNKLKRLLDKETYEIQVTVFVLLQPFIDIYRTLIGNQIQIVGLSLVEFVNFFLVGYLLLLGFYHWKDKKRMLWIIGYLVMIGIYAVIHGFHIMKFDTSIITNTDINFFKECWFIIRSYVLPLCALLIFLIADGRKEKFFSIIMYLSCIISGVIIITNICNISYVAYASDLPEGTTISYNIFHWFSGEDFGNVTLMTSKGWFYSGNQIGLILFMMYPIVCYNFINEKGILNWVTLISVPIAMMMIGTKTATYGCLLVLVIEMVLLLLFQVILHKSKFQPVHFLVLLCVCIGSYLLMQNSPVILMQTAQDESYIRDEDVDKMLEDGGLENLDGSGINVEKLKYFLEDMPGVFGVHPDYVKLYPIEQNPQFWYDVVMDQSMAQVNFRDFKGRIFEAVKADNANPMDTWLGIGYTSNFPYIEKDIIAQNAWLGMIGTLLLIGPFYCLLLLSAIRILKDMKCLFTMENCILGLSVCCAFAISLVAGHLFGYVFPSFITAFVLAKLYQNTKKVR